MLFFLIILIFLLVNYFYLRVGSQVFLCRFFISFIFFIFIIFLILFIFLLFLLFVLWFVFRTRFAMLLQFLKSSNIHLQERAIQRCCQLACSFMKYLSLRCTDWSFFGQFSVQLLNALDSLLKLFYLLWYFFVFSYRTRCESS